jgi:hypothetical protein
MEPAMDRPGLRPLRLVASLILGWVLSAAAQAQDFYKGKQIDLYIGYSVGGAMTFMSVAMKSSRASRMITPSP